MISSLHFKVLKQILARLQDQPIEWVVTGSLGMALQGVPVEVHDIDLQTDQAGAYAIERCLAEYVTMPVHYLASERIRSHFGQLQIDGMQVEIMGALQKRLTPSLQKESSIKHNGMKMEGGREHKDSREDAVTGAPEAVWEEPVQVERYRRWVEVDGQRTPVLSLEYEYQAYLRIGRTAKAALLREWLDRQAESPRGPKTR